MFMVHLSPEQLVDVAEGTAEVARAAHAASCESCGARVAALEEALRLAKSDPLPEPSPLVQDRLAARISEAVRRERQSRGSWRARFWQLAPVGAAAAVVIAVGLGMQLWPAPAGLVDLALPVPPAEFAEIGIDAGDNVQSSDDPSWALVADLTGDVAFDEAETLGVLPATGMADRALLQLDESERIELARILREELARRAAAGPKGSGA